MEKKKKSVMDRQKKFLLPLTTGMILLAVLFYLIYNCLTVLKRTERTLAEVKRKERAIDKMQTLKAKEEDLLKAFPSVQKKNDIIEEIAGWARKEGLEVNEIEPKELTVTGTNFRQLSLTLNGRGTYLPITRFLKRIESSPYFILASGLQLGGYELRTSRSRYSMMNRDVDYTSKGFKVTVNVFMLQ